MWFFSEGKCASPSSDPKEYRNSTESIQVMYIGHWDQNGFLRLKSFMKLDHGAVSICVSCYRKISRTIKASRFEFRVPASLWNLVDAQATLPPAIFQNDVEIYSPDILVCQSSRDAGVSYGPLRQSPGSCSDRREMTPFRGVYGPSWMNSAPD